MRLPWVSDNADQCQYNIRKQGAAVVLEPMASGWEWLDAIAGEFSDDFFAGGRKQPELLPGRDLMTLSSDPLPPRYERLHRPAQQDVTVADGAYTPP